MLNISLYKWKNQTAQEKPATSRNTGQWRSEALNAG
jgi:hypothetical protein